MKKTVASIAVALLCALQAGFAQTLPVPSWVPEKGYWVIESNRHSPKKNIISFFNNDNVLVHKEKVDNHVLNLKRRKVKLQLKKMLEAALSH